MHNWGDEGVDWNGINDAADYIGSYCKRWAYLGGQVKEKYGTVRFYANFGHLNLHCLFFPGYVYCQFPDWLWHLDCKYIGPFMRFFFEKAFVKWQSYIYGKAYLNACRKWPHLQEEILCSADYIELVPGCFKKEGKTTHVLDLTGKKVGAWVSG